MTDGDFDPRQVAWVMDQQQLAHLCAAAVGASEAVLDLETTGVYEHARRGGPLNGGVAARIVLASLTLPRDGDPPGQADTWVIPLSHPESPWLGSWRKVIRTISEAIVASGRLVSGHNIKFDARWIYAHTGVDLSARLGWDTMMSAHLLDETTSTRLKERAPKTFGVPAWDDFDLSYPGAAEEVPLVDLGLYAARDTYWTWRLAVAHRDEMFLDDAEGPQGAEEVIDARLGRLAVWCGVPMVASLTAIEQRGIGLDVQWCRDQLVQERQEAARLQVELAHRYPEGPEGEPSFAPTSLWFKAWTALAVDAGDLVVAEMTATGASRWSKGVLVRQSRAGSEVAGKLLTWRGHTKRAEYLSSWLGFVAADGRIHSTYHAARVVTGRLSSSDPNMQQVTAALKPAFVPRPGHLIAELDYSQIELRVAAFISGCEPMLEAFRRGDDLHRLLASRITGKDPVLVSPAERQAGKSANFGLIYGMSPNGFRAYSETVYGVSFTADEAAQVHRTFFETWDGLLAWHAQAARRARTTGQVISPIGRVRRLPDIHDGNPERSSYAERQAVNAPVQGFASDLMQMAAASIAGLLPFTEPVPGASLVATVHDSIVVEVEEASWEDVVANCTRRMLHLEPVLARLGCELTVPLAVEAHIGSRWGLTDIAVVSSDDLL